MKKLIIVTAMLSTALMAAPVATQPTQEVPPAAVVTALILFPLINGGIMITQGFAQALASGGVGCTGTIYGFNFKDGALNLRGWDNCAADYTYLEKTVEVQPIF